MEGEAKRGIKQASRKMAAMLAFALGGISFFLDVPNVVGHLIFVVLMVLAAVFGGALASVTPRFLRSKWRYVPIEILVVLGVAGWMKLWLGVAPQFSMLVGPMLMLSCMMRVVPGLIFQTAFGSVAQASRLRESQPGSPPP